MKTLLIFFVLQGKASVHGATKTVVVSENVTECHNLGEVMSMNYAYNGFFTKFECVEVK